MEFQKKLYDLWRGMNRRCSDSRHISFPYYGAKGVKVCARWAASFQAFMQDMGPRPDGCSIDRIDSTKDYGPTNCRWATITQQNRNKSDTILVEIDGITKPMSVWAKERGMKPQTIHQRIRKSGLTPQEALSFPALPRSERRRGLSAQKEIR